MLNSTLTVRRRLKVNRIPVTDPVVYPPSSCALHMTHMKCRQMALRKKTRFWAVSRLHGSYPETGFGEVSGGVLEADFTGLAPSSQHQRVGSD